MMNILSMFLNLLNADSGMSWHPKEALSILPKMGIGMLVIFAVIGVIIVATLLISKIFSSKNKDK